MDEAADAESRHGRRPATGGAVEARTEFDPRLGQAHRTPRIAGAERTLEEWPGYSNPVGRCEQ